MSRLILMRKLIPALALALALAWPATAEASTTSIRATPSSSIVGQAVTFTATFTSSCPGSLTTHYFTIDGKVYNGKLAQSGQAGSETLSISTLGVGAHSVTYNWKISGTICRGIASMTYTVASQPSPSPTPSPTPTPSPSPSPTPVLLTSSTASGGSDTTLGYLGAGLIVFVIAAGIALAVLGRR
jgi:hypothetical protein